MNICNMCFRAVEGEQCICGSAAAIYDDLMGEYYFQFSISFSNCNARANYKNFILLRNLPYYIALRIYINDMDVYRGREQRFLDALTEIMEKLSYQAVTDIRPLIAELKATQPKPVDYTRNQNNYGEWKRQMFNDRRLMNQWLDPRRRYYPRR